MNMPMSTNNGEKAVPSNSHHGADINVRSPPMAIKNVDAARPNKTAA